MVTLISRTIMPEKPFLTLCPQLEVVLKRNVAIPINVKRGKDSSWKITVCVSFHVSQLQYPFFLRSLPTEKELGITLLNSSFQVCQV